MGKMLSLDEVKKFALDNFNLSLVGKYEGVQYKTQWKCIKCGNIINASYNTLKYYKRHNYCACQECKRKKRENDINNTLQSTYGVKMISGYTTRNDSSAKFKCLKCGRVFNSSLAIINNWNKTLYGCGECRQTYHDDTMRISEDYVKKWLKDICHISLLSNYENNSTPMLMRCDKCGYLFSRTYADMRERYTRHGSTCPKCGGVVNLCHDINDINAQIKDIGIQMLDDYHGVAYTNQFKCLKCGHHFSAKLNNMMTLYKQHTCGCPRCRNKLYGCSSILEYKVQTFLEEHGIAFECHKRFDDLRRNRPLSYDFFVPSHKLLIEVQGQQHEKPIEMFGGKKAFDLQRQSDDLKAQYAKDHGYRLCSIWYYNINNYQDILSNYLQLIA